jgi:hypothetical protein
MKKEHGQNPQCQRLLAYNARKNSTFADTLDLLKAELQ